MPQTARRAHRSDVDWETDPRPSLLAGDRPGASPERRPTLVRDCGASDDAQRPRSEAAWARQPGSEARPRLDRLIDAPGLVREIRAMRETYEREAHRLSQAIERLTLQSRDLEYRLTSFDRLVDELAQREGASPWQAPAGLVGKPALRDVRGIADERLEIRCLGDFEAVHRGRPLDLGTSRKGRLIFKYLAVRAPGRRSSKELLAELFWPDTPLERALPSLQSAVHQVRRALTGGEPDGGCSPLLVFADDQYAIDPQLDVLCDAELFRLRQAEARSLEATGALEAACQAYRQAAETYAGELLPEERYEEWVMRERAALEAEYDEVLARLVQLNLTLGAHREGLRYGRVLLERDSSREDVHRDVMRCYDRLGQRPEAIRQYQRCSRALADELDLEPEPETVELYERVAGGAAI